jgi:hypothetical protein
VKAAGQAKAKHTVAYMALQKIAEISHYEGLFADLSAEDRLRMRQKTVKPLVEAFFAWIREFNPAIDRKTKTGAGFQYCLNQEPYLRYFLEDGRLFQSLCKLIIADIRYVNSSVASQSF